MVKFLRSYVNLQPIEKSIIKALTPIFGLHKSLAWSCWDGDLEKRVVFVIPDDSLRVLSPFLCSLNLDNVGPVLRRHSISPQLFFSLGCGLAQGGLRPSNPSWQLSNYCWGRLCPRHWVLNEGCGSYWQETGEFYFSTVPASLVAWEIGHFRLSPPCPVISLVICCGSSIVMYKVVGSTVWTWYNSI